MQTPNVKSAKVRHHLSWLQVTILVCGFWLTYLVGNTRNPLANFAAVSVYDVKTVDVSMHLVLQLLAGPLAGTLIITLLITVIGGRNLWRALLQHLSARDWWCLVPLSVVMAALRWGLTTAANQLPWTWLNSDVIADIQWFDFSLIGVVAVRELLTLATVLLVLLTVLIAFEDRVRLSWRWVLYLALGVLAAGLGTTSLQPTFVRNLLVLGVPAIASLLVYSRWRNFWFVLLSYELVWRIVCVGFVLFMW